MKRRFLKIFLLTAGLLLASPLLTLASPYSDVIQGFTNTGRESGYAVEQSGAPTQEFGQAWMRYVDGMVTLMGVLFMIMVVYGGFLWMTARGKDEQVQKGKEKIVQAFIGLGIVIAARVLVELTIIVLGQIIGL